MMSLQTIVHLENEIARKARGRGLTPYVPADSSEPFRWTNIPIPNLGSHRPKGWKLVKAAFVSKSPDPGGPAMGHDMFKQWVSKIVSKDMTAGFGMVSEGQFQVYVGYFTQTQGEPAKVDFPYQEDWE